MELIDGFYKPVISQTACVSCGMCVSVCPQNSDVRITNYQTKAYACKNNDNAVRVKSSSGGVFTVLSESVLSEGGVVYGVAFDKQFLTHHIRVDSMIDMVKLRRSKYLQSYVGDVFKNIKRDMTEGRKVLFSGTPCQCAGLNAYLEGNRENLIIVEVLCHGVPSPVIWKNYLDYRVKKSKNSSRVENCMFRTKDACRSASWNNSYMYIKLDSEDYIVNSDSDPFMMLFARSDIILNDSCYECRYRELVNRGFADISLCDFWNIDRIAPSFNDGGGISLMMIHSQSGENLAEECIKTMAVAEVEPQRALLLNSSSHQPKQINQNSKVRSSLIRFPAKFGRIYFTYLPVIYGRKVIDKIKKILKRQ